MTEIAGRLSPRFVRTVVEAMTALPSIIAGLFIYATFILILNRDKSGLAASLAIGVMMLPIIIRAADVVIRLVAGNLKEASYALGASQVRTVWHVVLPTARSGLMTAVILGTARGIGETSPVLLTAGFTQSLNLNPTTGPMVNSRWRCSSSSSRPQRRPSSRGSRRAVRRGDCSCSSWRASSGCSACSSPRQAKRRAREAHGATRPGSTGARGERIDSSPVTPSWPH